MWLSYIDLHYLLLTLLQKKSEYIKKTTKLLEEKFAGDIPNCVEDLVSVIVRKHL